MQADPKSTKKDIDDLTVSLCFWDLHMKKLCVNMLMKSTTGVDFVSPIFLYKSIFRSFSLNTICVCDILAKENWQKTACKLLKLSL
jgi:hypothetical protein